MAARFLAITRPELLPHVLPWLTRAGGGGGATAVASQYERACPEVLPLLSTPGWIVTAATDRASLPPQLQVISALEAAFPAIRREFLALRGARSFQQYRAPAAAAGGAAAEARAGAAGGGAAAPAQPLGASATDAGEWSVCYLQLHNAREAEGAGAAALGRCPATAAVLAGLGARAYGHAFFSVLQPGTHITQHCGPTNKKVRVHLPLVVPAPQGCARLRVGARTLPLEEGKCLAFQDSWEHEAWVDEGAGSTRATLILDIWHPLLTDAEVKLLAFLRASAMRGCKAASEGGAIPPEEDFYRVLQASRDAGCEDEAVFQGCPVVDD